MAYTCPTCSGTGKVSGSTCPRCLGNKTLVEDSQGLSVTWGGVALGRLTSFRVSSPQVAIEDVTNLNSAIVDYTNAFGNYRGMVRQLMSGDVTPGKVDISWNGSGALSSSDVGQEQALEVTHPEGSIAGTLKAILLEFQTTAGVNALIEGTASFQLTEV